MIYVWYSEILGFGFTAVIAGKGTKKHMLFCPCVNKFLGMFFSKPAVAAGHFPNPEYA